MKFLVSGALTRKSRFQRLILILLVFFLLFNVFHGISYFTQTLDLDLLLDKSQSIASIPDNHIGSGQQDADQYPGFLLKRAVLESLHIDLFIFSFQFLFCASLIVQLPLRGNWHNVMINTPAILWLSWAFLRLVRSDSDSIGWLVILAINALMCYLAFIIMNLMPLIYYKVLHINKTSEKFANRG